MDRKLAVHIVDDDPAILRALKALAEAISDDHQDVAREVDGHHHAVRLPGAGPQGDLDHQRDRVGEQRDPKVHSKQEDLSERGVGLENHVHGDPRGVEEMEDADQELEGGPKPLRHPL